MAVDVGDAVSPEVLQEERRQNLFLGDGRGVLDEADAAAYVAERGFVHLFSPGGLPWPNVSDAELRARGSIETFFAWKCGMVEEHSAGSETLRLRPLSPPPCRLHCLAVLSGIPKVVGTARLG